LLKLQLLMSENQNNALAGMSMSCCFAPADPRKESASRLETPILTEKYNEKLWVVEPE
jgi:hypothetical protein